MLEVSNINGPMDKYQTFLEGLLARTSITIAKRPVSRLSVIFAIIQRKTVGDVVNPITSNNPRPCFLFNSLTLKIAKIKVMKDKIGITNIPGMPRKCINGMERTEYRTLGATSPQVSVFSGDRRLASKELFLMP